ncbi:2Fe-2S iron-sulfur cluster-binding protein [Mycobacterium sp. NPDC003449]
MHRPRPATPETRRVVWIHSTREPAGHAFKDEVDALFERLPNAERHVFYTAPPAHRLDRTAVAALDLPRDSTVYLCGPDSFMADMQAALAAAGIGSVHTEQFGARTAINPGAVVATARRPHPPEGEPGTGPAVTFVRTGLSTSWSTRHRTLLELAEACDVPTRYSCRSGVCHICLTDVVSGDISYVTEPLDPPAPGTALICCAAPGTDVVLDL